MNQRPVSIRRVVLALWDLLTELNSAGQTVMLTTHYMEEADQLCDRVAIMDHGKILALDTPANLKKSTGADTIVTIKVAANAEQLAENLKRDIDAIVTTRVQENSLIVDMRSTERLVPRSWRRPSRPTSRSSTWRSPNRRSRPSSSISTGKELREV